MAFINITIVQDEKKLNEIICKLNKLLAELGGNENDEVLKQQIADKLKKATEDIKSTIK